MLGKDQRTSTRPMAIAQSLPALAPASGSLRPVQYRDAAGTARSPLARTTSGLRIFFNCTDGPYLKYWFQNFKIKACGRSVRPGAKALHPIEWKLSAASG
jgi:hypothetical protein